MAWDFDAFGPAITKSATELRVAGVRDQNGMEIVVTGTGLTYDSTTGFLDGGTITKLELFDVSGSTPVLQQTIDVPAGMEAAHAFAVYNAGFQIQSQMSAWDFTMAMNDGPASWSSTEIRAVGTNTAGTETRYISIQGTGFVRGTGLGTVTAIQLLDASGAVVTTLATGLPASLPTIFLSLGGEGAIVSYVWEEGNNTVTEAAGNQNWMEGSAGNDTFVGNATGTRSVDFGTVDNPTGVTVSLGMNGANGSATGDGNDTLVNIDNAGGTYFADVLNGNQNSNILWGGGGNDAIAGGDGNDILLGNEGNDLLVGGSNNDEIIGGAGWDRADFDYASTQVSINHAPSGWTSIVGSGSLVDTLKGVEVARFTDRDVAIKETTRTDLTGRDNSGNYDGSGSSDMVLQSGGTVVAWIVENSVAIEGRLIGGGVDGWTVEGTGDFNGDGTSDIILQNGGTVVQWTMKDGYNSGGTLVGAGIDGWDVKGTGDFNLDGTTDVVLQNGGTVVAWTMQNGVAASGTVVGAGVDGWDVVGTGDFNGDGTSDILLQNGGTLVAWDMRNGANIGGTVLSSGIDGWQVVGTGDFNGDGTTDVLVKNGGAIVDLLVQNNVATTGNLIGAGLEAWTVGATGDYNGDGVADIALTSGGIVVNWTMNNGLVQSGNVLGGNGTFAIMA